MYPNATHGYMPFLKHKRQPLKQKFEKYNSLGHGNIRHQREVTKTYKVTMRDRKGFTYTYIIQADGSKSVPVLCESRVSPPSASLLTSSLPNMRSTRYPVCGYSSSCASLAEGKEDLSKLDDGEKKGLFTSLLQYIRKKTSKSCDPSKSVIKSKRRQKPLPRRKRQRTISAMSNLDPIFESPDEDTVEEADSFSNDSIGSDSTSGDGHGSCPLASWWLLSLLM